jgi:hypothetical protein
MTPEHPDLQELNLQGVDPEQRRVTPKLRAWWMRGWGQINLVIIFALLLFVMWSTFCNV